MTGRERHIKVLEEFYRHHYQYDCGDYSGIGDDVAKAIQYAINSIKTDLKYDLLYEGEEPTTKNDLEVDCMARQDVERFIEGFINEYTPKEELEFINLELDGLKHLPSVTPQEPRKGHWIKYGIPRCGEQHYKCTNCDEYFNFGLYSDYYKKAFKYCPNCGADMREVEK